MSYSRSHVLKQLAVQKSVAPSEVKSYLRARNDELVRLRAELAEQQRTHRQLLRQHNQLLASACSRELEATDLLRTTARLRLLEEQMQQLEARCSMLEMERAELLELCELTAAALETEHGRRLGAEEEAACLAEHVEHLEAMVEFLEKQLDLLRRA